MNTLSCAYPENNDAPDCRAAFHIPPRAVHCFQKSAEDILNVLEDHADAADACDSLKLGVKGSMRPTDAHIPFLLRESIEFHSTR